VQAPVKPDDSVPPELARARVWILTDGKAGDENQCIGIAEALGLAYETRRGPARAPAVRYRRASPALAPAPVRSRDAKPSIPPNPAYWTGSPQLSALPASSGGAWYDPASERRRVAALAEHYAQWLRRRPLPPRLLRSPPCAPP
jgi:hypothetical protein